MKTKITEISVIFTQKIPQPTTLCLNPINLHLLPNGSNLIMITLIDNMLLATKVGKITEFSTYHYHLSIEGKIIIFKTPVISKT